MSILKPIFLFIEVLILSFYCCNASERNDQQPYSPSPPDPFDKIGTARWMVDWINYGVLATYSTRLPFYPFGNVYSFAAVDGIPYFYGTMLDQSFQDVRQNPNVSLTLSEASLTNNNNNNNFLDRTALESSSVLSSCDIQQYGDPESPVCARLVLSGQFDILVDVDAPEFLTAKEALFTRHPQMKSWPRNHQWLIGKLNIQDIWLIDYFGGPSILNVTEYLDYEPVAST